MASRYDHLSREELLRLLDARDRRDATRFGLVWEANEIERDRAINSDFVALDLVSEQCVGPGPWRNLIIEGDNFDALRHLRMTHAGEVKCILIDPPYNTGKKDFVYNDHFVDENDSWRFSTWVEFLYLRLIIARDLLREDGVMLVCINDENRAKLELLLDKVMPGRRIGSFVWRTKDSANDSGGNLSQVHEHVLVYSNPRFEFAGKVLTLDEYRNPDNDPEGDWTPQPLTKAETFTTRANTYYPIQDPATGYWYPCDPDRVWAYATEKNVKEGMQLRSDTIEELIRKKEIYFPACKPQEVMQWNTLEDLKKAIRAGKGPRLPKKKTPLLREDLPDLDRWVGKPIAPGRPSRKDYLKRKTKLVAPLSSWIAGKNEEVDYTFDDMENAFEVIRSERGGEGTDTINAILGNKAFNFPKPPSLIRALVKQAAPDPDDLVVDFFGGSGTTAHAVLQRNAEDRGRRRFILVSNTEATPTEPAKNICRDVCARRVRGVIAGYGEISGLPGDFAYLRCRRIQPGRLLDIEHAQVWTALQMLHLDTLMAYVEAPYLAAGGEDQLVVYIPRFTADCVAALRTVVKPCRSAVIYSWQPENLRQKIRFGHVEHAAIPESLALRFGLRP